MSNKLQTRLTQLLGVQYPVMSAGMGGVAYHKLVAAVSEAGGFGTIGAAVMSEEELKSEIAEVRKLTKKPFGVDLLGAVPNLDQMVDIIIEGGAKAFITGLGFQKALVEKCHASGLLVGVVIGKVSHASKSLQAGVDFVICQGTEAGGHTGEVALMPLLPQVVEAVGAKIPVIAAGGICNGRQLVASLALGADGIWVGTRFIGTPEARSVKGYKEAILSSKEDSTVISKAYTGKPCRVRRTAWTDEWSAKPNELNKFPMQIVVSRQAGCNHIGGDENTEGIDPTTEFYMMGQGVGLINEIIPAGDVVLKFVKEAEELLDAFAARRITMFPATNKSAKL